MNEQTLIDLLQSIAIICYGIAISMIGKGEE